MEKGKTCKNSGREARQASWETHSDTHNFVEKWKHVKQRTRSTSGKLGHTHRTQSDTHTHRQTTFWRKVKHVKTADEKHVRQAGTHSQTHRQTTFWRKGKHVKTADEKHVRQSGTHSDTHADTQTTTGTNNRHT